MENLKNQIFALADKIDHVYPDGNILFIANAKFWALWSQIKQNPALKQYFHVEKHIIGQYVRNGIVHTTYPRNGVWLVETLFK